MQITMKLRMTWDDGKGAAIGAGCNLFRPESVVLPFPVNLKSLACLGLLSSALAVVAQPSTFTYQGQLSSNGLAATGLFDARFTLFDAATLGGQVGSPISVAPLGVTNGLFAAELTFGSGAFDGSPRWLEIGVRTNGSVNAYTTLAPRQLLTATPYAVRAANYSGAVAATNLTGKLNDTNLSANVPLLTNNVVFTRSVTASNFIGNGIGLTNLSTTNLVGTLPDARLSTNVAFLNTNAYFKASVLATNFVGNGVGLTNVPGRIFEVIPTAANIQALANFGYLATNNTSAVVVTLPPTANIRVGETVRVAGSGAGGWVVAQNAGQSILMGNLLNTVGVNWTTNGSALIWKTVASSADGQNLVAATSGAGGQIHTSTNYGANWTPRSVLGNISAVASSADGTKLVAALNGGFIWTSIDSGATWIQRAGSGNRNWTSVASSLDGTRLVACATSSGVYISSDAGTSWPLSLSGVVSWSGVASSGNGSNLVATIQGGQIGVSTNAGANWIGRDSNRSWTCIASSSDGSVLVAGVNSSGYLYTSTDFGASWLPGTVGLNWAGVACSADGARMIAVANGGGVYVSLDTGVNWQLRANLPTSGPVYTGAASSSDGSTMVAVANASGIFVSSEATTTVGVTGSLTGARLSAVELEYVGNGVFMPVTSLGTIRAQ